MIDSSKEFREVINNNSRVMSIHDEYIFADGTSLDINRKVFKRYSINEATSDSSGFNIGATVIKEYKASLDNTDGIFDAFDFEGLDIAAKVGLLLKDGSVEVIPKGKFRCVSAKNNENTIDIKAYDSMLFFDRPYTESNLRYPATIQQIIADACLCCEMTYDASTIQNNDYVVNERPEDSNLTFRDVIGFCAQIMCSYAVINKLDQLSFGWYDFDTLGKLQNNYDGGSFAYTDGDTFDGGSFTDYSSGDSVDGGSFEEQRVYHHLYSLGSRSINTDDIRITGIAVKPSSDYVDGDSIYLCGEEGYVLLIEENPLIQSVAQTETVAKYIAEKMNGKGFRPLNISCKSNPCIEAGDCVCVTDRKNRTYFTVITNTTFSFGALQQIECTAETPTEKNFTKYSATTKLLSKAKNETKKQLATYDLAVQQLTNLITNSFGVFKTEEKQEDGSVIYYLHNKPVLNDSSTVWKMTADAFSVSTDGGKTWNAGMDAAGNAVVNVLNAIGINANWIRVGIIQGLKGKSFWNLDTGELYINGKFSQSNIDGIQSVKIENNQIDFHNWNDNGEFVGSIGSVKNISSDRVGLAIGCEQGCDITLGVLSKNNEGNMVLKPVFQINGDTYEDTPPWIKNTATGTLFPKNSGGGIKVVNGLITDWNLNTATGTISIDGEGSTVNIKVENGLITTWSYS